MFLIYNLNHNITLFGITFPGYSVMWLQEGYDLYKSWRQAGFINKERTCEFTCISFERTTHLRLSLRTSHRTFEDGKDPGMAESAGAPRNPVTQRQNSDS